jgi:hypothetical protein
MSDKSVGISLKKLKDILNKGGESEVKIILPNGVQIPSSFHVTEVGLVNKVFIDCGGKVRSQTSCALQTWLGDDKNHRLNAGKMAKILDLSKGIIPDDNIPVEIEYEDGVISQYPVIDHSVSGGAIILEVGNKHTDCLAKEICIKEESACCSGGKC